MGRYSRPRLKSTNCSSGNECDKQLEECLNSQNEACDSCCVQNIKEELCNLKNQTVRIDTQTRSYVGIINSVDCDIVSLGAITGTVATIISICKIEAIVPATTTVKAEFNLGDTDIANKA
ncbi:hypothetical protein [Bacillus sp. FDAARGOS_1420]|uniref:hypothetical protein n=1 Tax=unclassified Bacillus (in: firmicutes) TaxID=185979 RepID=UPI001C5B3289|nr:hypothetical protein [Bacillus sp. FDAARGOS_1420]MBW3492080.1 hypothetical protein [Bacillus sp. FDAARGOS_1420]